MPRDHRAPHSISILLSHKASLRLRRGSLRNFDARRSSISTRATPASTGAQKDLTSRCLHNWHETAMALHKLDAGALYSMQADCSCIEVHPSAAPSPLCNFPFDRGSAPTLCLKGGLIARGKRKLGGSGTPALVLFRPILAALLVSVSLCSGSSTIVHGTWEPIEKNVVKKRSQVIVSIESNPGAAPTRQLSPNAMSVN